MSQAVSKVCCVCQQDVSGLPRTKDQHGNYYCQPCYEAATSPQEVPVEEEAPLYACATCGGVFGLDGVYSENGSVICKGCFQRRSAAVSTARRAVPKGPTIYQGPKANRPSQETKKSSNRSVLIALALIAVALVGTFNVYYFMYMAPIHQSVVEQNENIDTQLDTHIARLEAKLDPTPTDDKEIPNQTPSQPTVSEPPAPELDKATRDKLSDAWLHLVEGIDGEAEADAAIARYRSMGMARAQMVPMLETRLRMIEWQSSAKTALAAHSPEVLRLSAEPILAMQTVSDEAKAAIVRFIDERTAADDRRRKLGR